MIYFRECYHFGLVNHDPWAPASLLVYSDGMFPAVLKSTDLMYISDLLWISYKFIASPRLAWRHLSWVSQHRHKERKIASVQLSEKYNAVDDNNGIVTHPHTHLETSETYFWNYGFQNKNMNNEFWYMVGVYFSHWIFRSEKHIKKQKNSGYSWFDQKLKLKFKLFFFIRVKKK